MSSPEIAAEQRLLNQIHEDIIAAGYLPGYSAISVTGYATPAFDRARAFWENLIQIEESRTGAVVTRAPGGKWTADELHRFVYGDEYSPWEDFVSFIDAVGFEKV